MVAAKEFTNNSARFCATYSFYLLLASLWVSYKITVVRKLVAGAEYTIHTVVMLNTIKNHQKIFVKQSFELAEIFDFETRNKYRICDEAGRDIAFAAEQQKGFLGFLFRQFFGHWRSFEIHFYDVDRKEFMIARHPFRWFFQRIDLFGIEGRQIGSIERRFSILAKRFEVQDPHGRVLLEVSSPIWRIWTFPFMHGGREVSRISKKWTGLGYELFTDKDTFLVEYNDPALSQEERALVLTAAIYVDLMFFEKKGSGGGINLLAD